MDAIDLQAYLNEGSKQARKEYINKSGLRKAPLPGHLGQHDPTSATAFSHDSDGQVRVWQENSPFSHLHSKQGSRDPYGFHVSPCSNLSPLYSQSAEEKKGRNPRSVSARHFLDTTSGFCLSIIIYISICVYIYIYKHFSFNWW